MSIAGKIKGLLLAHGKDYAGLAAAFGISTQALSNKFYRNSFSASDLIVIADYVNCDIAFLSPDGSKTILDISDIKKKNSSIK